MGDKSMLKDIIIATAKLFFCIVSGFIFGVFNYAIFFWFFKFFLNL
jgi:hypothetical protein